MNKKRYDELAVWINFVLCNFLKAIFPRESSDRAIFENESVYKTSLIIHFTEQLIIRIC